MAAQVFVEGGGQGRNRLKGFRNAFISFLERAGANRRNFRVIACGSRGDTYRKFSSAVRKGEPAMLLVDAEQPVTASGPWQHLRESDGWDRPGSATDDQCHLMVQIMESWFLADAEAVESYYGPSFRMQDLPRNPNVEQVPRQDVLSGLERAASNTRKSGYSKGKHSFEILARIDPAKVRVASPYANRFISALV